MVILWGRGLSHPPVAAGGPARLRHLPEKGGQRGEGPAQVLIRTDRPRDEKEVAVASEGRPSRPGVSPSTPAARALARAVTLGLMPAPDIPEKIATELSSELPGRPPSYSTSAASGC